MIAKVIICIMLLNNFSSLNSKSCKEYPKIEHRFHLLRHCQRSNKSIIAFSNVDSLTECSDLARTNRALAFNFSPGDRRKINLFQKGNESLRGSDEFFNCEVLDCPEYRGFPSLVNDTRFDYYSLYTRPPRESKFNWWWKMFEKTNFRSNRRRSNMCSLSRNVYVFQRTKQLLSRLQCLRFDAGKFSTHRVWSEKRWTGEVSAICYKLICKGKSSFRRPEWSYVGQVFHIKRWTFGLLWFSCVGPRTSSGDSKTRLRRNYTRVVLEGFQLQSKNDVLLWTTHIWTESLR